MPCSAGAGWRKRKQLLQRGLAQNQTAMQALGYRQIVEHLRGRALAPGDDCAGEDPHPAIRQAADDLVPAAASVDLDQP